MLTGVCYNQDKFIIKIYQLIIAINVENNTLIIKHHNFPTAARSYSKTPTSISM